MSASLPPVRCAGRSFAREIEDDGVAAAIGALHRLERAQLHQLRVALRHARGVGERAHGRDLAARALERRGRGLLRDGGRGVGVAQFLARS